MRNILSLAHVGLLRQFAWSNVLLAFDYDGTLAPIVSDPARATMRAGTRGLLDRLTRAYPCIVISGRSRADASRLLRGTGVLQVIGNHGAEPLAGNERFLRKVALWKPQLAQRLDGLRGVSIEDKTYSVAVHYGRSRRKGEARAAILAAAESLAGVRIIGGKQVVNLLPEGAPHKGIALERERTRFACDTAIYVGDDETDEDVFSMDQPGRLLPIRVGPKRTSAATYHISSQAEIDGLMRALLELRRGREAREGLRAAR